MRKGKGSLLKRFSGTTTGDAILMGLSQRYVDFINSADFQLIGKHETLISQPRKAEVPRRARRGAGEVWIEIFAKYDGDLCVLFPFRTAATPRGSVTFNYQRMSATRAMCLRAHKLPPEGKDMALHSCGNGHLACVNPRHLYWGDASENTKDAHRHRIEGKQAA